MPQYGAGGLSQQWGLTGVHGSGVEHFKKAHQLLINVCLCWHQDVISCSNACDIKCWDPQGWNGLQGEYKWHGWWGLVSNAGEVTCNLL